MHDPLSTFMIIKSNITGKKRNFTRCDSLHNETRNPKLSDLGWGSHMHSLLATRMTWMSQIPLVMMKTVIDVIAQSNACWQHAVRNAANVVISHLPVSENHVIDRKAWNKAAMSSPDSFSFAWLKTWFGKTHLLCRTTEQLLMPALNTGRCGSQIRPCKLVCTCYFSSVAFILHM